METVFLKILNMSITASWLTVAVMLIRLLFKRHTPKSLMVILWGLVGIRLVFPYSLESILSLIPSAETVPTSILYSSAPTIHSGVNLFNAFVNPIISESLAPSVGASVNPAQVITYIASVVWTAGMAVMLLYGIISYIRIHGRIREAAPLEGRVWLCDRIDTPFILGFFRPRIFIPSSMSESDRALVIAHERAHLERGDHIIKPLGFLLLTIYWFNPVLWLAYVLFCRDIELACDERVIKKLGVEIKKQYSETLINCSAPQRAIAACPLAFGETAVKERIKTVLNYKKPVFWIVAAAVLACVAVAVCFLTDPIGSPTPVGQSVTPSDAMNAFIDEQVVSNCRTEESDSRFICFDRKVFSAEQSGDRTTVYMLVLYQEYDFYGLEVLYGTHAPTAVTVEEQDGEYILIEYWTPENGSYNKDEIRAKFPKDTLDDALNPQKFLTDQISECEKMASDNYFNVSDELIFAAYGTDNCDATFTLHRPDKRFEFVLSYSAPTNPQTVKGTYELTDDKLTLTADDGIHGFVFERRGYRFFFSSQQSSLGNMVYFPDATFSETITYYNYDTPKGMVIDYTYTDIDGDGNNERCVLSYGPTSGLFTFELSAYTEGDKIGDKKYFNIYNTGWYDLSFTSDENGTVYVCGKDSRGKAHLFKMNIDGDSISLSENGEPLDFWGIQGIDSDFTG